MVDNARAIAIHHGNDSSVTQTRVLLVQLRVHEHLRAAREVVGLAEPRERHTAQTEVRLLNHPVVLLLDELRVLYDAPIVAREAARERPRLARHKTPGEHRGTRSSRRRLE